MSIERRIGKTGKFNKLLAKTLRDPLQSAAYLQVALEDYQVDGNLDFFLLALRNIAEYHGGLGQLAQNTGLNRPTLYKTLSEDGNPRLSTLTIILKELGFKLSVQANDK